MKQPKRIAKSHNKVVGNTLALGRDSQLAAVTYMNNCIQRFNFAQRRHIYEKIDKAIQLESDTRRNLGVNRDQRYDYFDDTEVSLVTQAVDTVKGFLVDLFLARPSIFEAVPPSKDDMGIAMQVDAVNERDSKDYAWARNLTIAFGDLAKYNKCAIEVDWDTRLVQQLQTSNAGSRSSKSVSEVPTSGNKIKRLDIYNVFHDELVEPAEVHMYGEFVGYTEKISMVEMVRRIKVMKAQGKAVMNQHDCFKASTPGSLNSYMRPCIVPEAPQAGDNDTAWGGNWEMFFGQSVTDGSKYKANPMDEYLWTVMYTRVIPSMLGITELGQPDTVHILRLIKVGDTLVACERMNNVHNYFNIITPMIKEDGIGEQVKSDAQLVIPMQNLATKLYDARLRSLAQATGNKYAYIEGTVDVASLRHPSAPIAVKPNMLNKDPLQSVKQLPFTDQMAANFHQEIGFLKQSASEITRLNRAQMGQFQKGNKTASEFNEIMNNADSDLRTYGLMFENVVMEPIKTIIRANIAQYQDADEIVTSLGDSVEVNPLLLSTKVINFKLADGLAKKESIASLDPLINSYTQLLANPMLAAQFDVAGLYVYINELMGAKISQFKLTAPAPSAGNTPPDPNNPQPGQAPAQTPV
jgi:hypothetical protein